MTEIENSVVELFEVLRMLNRSGIINQHNFGEILTMLEVADIHELYKELLEVEQAGVF